MFLSQTKYIKDLLSKANLSNAKNMPTPMVYNQKMSKHGSDYLSDPTYNRSIMGALQYAIITRPKISYAINKACQFMSQPLEIHWTTIKII